MSTTLAQEYRAHSGKVSDKWASYLGLYDSILGPRREELRTLLEIGIQNGGSLEIWARYFPKAERIIGCDIDAKCRDLRYADSRIRVIVGDATREATRAEIANACPAFDVVIEDGSHIPKDVIAAFALYWPSVKPGGLFIAEDLHCDYFPTHQGSISRRDTANRFFSQLTHLINYEHWEGVVAPQAIFGDFPTLNTAVAKSWIGTVASVSFHNSVIVVRKALQTEDTLLGGRVIVGDEAMVDSAVLAVRARGDGGLRGMRERPKMSSEASAQPPTSFAQIFGR